MAFGPENRPDGEDLSGDLPLVVDVEGLTVAFRGGAKVIHDAILPDHRMKCFRGRCTRANNVAPIVDGIGRAERAA